MSEWQSVQPQNLAIAGIERKRNGQDSGKQYRIGNGTHQRGSIGKTVRGNDLHDHARQKRHDCGSSSVIRGGSHSGSSGEGAFGFHSSSAGFRVTGRKRRSTVTSSVRIRRPLRKRLEIPARAIKTSQRSNNKGNLPRVLPSQVHMRHAVIETHKVLGWLVAQRLLRRERDRGADAAAKRKPTNNLLSMRARNDG